MKPVLPLNLRAALWVALGFFAVQSSSVFGAISVDLYDSTNPVPPFYDTDDVEYILNGDMDYAMSNSGYFALFGGDGSISFRSADASSPYILSISNSSGTDDLSGVSAYYPFFLFQEHLGKVEFAQLGGLSFSGLAFGIQQNAKLYAQDSGDDKTGEGGVLIRNIQGDVTFTDNYCPDWFGGGGIYSSAILDASATLETGSGSITAGTGVLNAGVYLQDITGNVNFTGNQSVEGDGGAVFVISSAYVYAMTGPGVLPGSTAQGGTALINEGLYLKGIDGNINFISNYAVSRGGGIGYSLNIDAQASSEESGGSVLRSGEATVNGGVHFQDVGGNITMTGNEAGDSGGAIFAYANVYSYGYKEGSDSVYAGKGTGYGGIEFANVTGSISFTGNTAYAELYDPTVELEVMGGGALCFASEANSEARVGGGTTGIVDGRGAESIIYGGTHFSQTGSILFSNNRSEEEGGAILIVSDANSRAYVDYGQIGSSYAGRAEAYQGLSFNGVTGDIRFEGNSSAAGGGAISSFITAESHADSLGVGDAHGGDAILDGDIVFSGVTGSLVFERNITGNRGGAILSYADAYSFLNAGNGSEAYGAKADVSGGIYFENIVGGVSFVSNEGVEQGGAISSWSNTYAQAYLNDAGYLDGSTAVAEIKSGVHFSNIRGGVQFIDNSVTAAAGDDQARGGAIAIDARAYAYLMTGGNLTGSGGGSAGTVIVNEGAFFENIIGGVTFSGNYAEQTGGAIYASALSSASLYDWAADGSEGVSLSGGQAQVHGGVSFKKITGDVLFENNTTDGEGGAIRLAHIKGADNTADDWSLYLSADGGDIIFRGNLGFVNISNAVYLTGAAFIDELKAAKGRTIAFYDPIYQKDDSGQILDINNWGNSVSQEDTGTILFSGELTKNYIIQEGGESDEDYQTRMEESLLSVIRQDAIQHKGVVQVEYDALLQTNSLTVNNAELITTENGLVRGVNYIQLNDALMDITRIASDCPLALDTPDLNGSGLFAYDKNGTLYTMGGVLDPSQAGNYRNLAYVNGEYKIALVTLQEVNSYYEDLYAGKIKEDRTGSDKYGYKPDWFLRWEETSAIGDREDPAHTLYLVWTTVEYDNDPAKKGESVQNSLWSSKSNTGTFSRSVLGQLTPCRFLFEKDTNIWAMGIGDFNMERSCGGIEGYDYWGGGYAAGIDTRIGKNLILGAAFGQIIGVNQSRSDLSSTDQDTLMGMVYGAYRQILNERDNMRYELSLAYGNTSNKMDSYDDRGRYAHGKWDNNTYGVNGRVYYDHKTEKNWRVSPFIGLEYTAGVQESFTETGRQARHFEESNLYNLAMPIGVEFTCCCSCINARAWENSIAVSYVPDIYRDNPSARTWYVADDTYTWTNRSINPSRHAGRVDLYSKYHFNDTWAAFGGYRLEFRENSVYQNVNLGLSYYF